MPKAPATLLIDYAKTHPEVKNLLEEYDESRNEKPLTKIYCKDSRNPVWWYCKKHDYHWQGYVSPRIHYPKAPCCAGHVATKERSLATEFPGIAADWDYDNNNGLTPEQVTPFSHMNANWKCHRCGYEWSTIVYSRTCRVSNCPNCSRKQTSKAEKILTSYLSDVFGDAHKIKIENTEFDIFIPTLKMVIEYDGYPWHLKKRNKHIEKLNLAKQNGLTLINIAEYKDKPEIIEAVKNQYTPEHNICFYEITSTYDLNSLLPTLINYLDKNGIHNLPQPDPELVQRVLSEKQVIEIEDSLWNSKEIPWIRNWIAPEAVEQAKALSKGSAEKILMQCPNCGRQWEIKIHWIKKQFRGCTKRSGGCGFQGMMDDQLEKTSERYSEGYQRRMLRNLT
jgi:hypothetical protein